MAKQWCFIFLWQTHFVAFLFPIQGHLDASWWKNPRIFSSLQQRSCRRFHPADFRTDSPRRSCSQYPTEMCTKIQSNEHTSEKWCFQNCGVNLKVLFIIRRINIDFNSLPTHRVISLATQHRCKQGWCHTFSPRSETWVGRQAWKLALQTLIGLKLLATTDQ